MSMQKHFKLNFSSLSLLSAILFSGCTSEKYRDLITAVPFLLKASLSAL
jgi:hypothetical protein